MKGIDVSTLQGVIDWARVGVDFAMIKATQGRDDTLYTASMFVNDDSYTVNGVQYDDVTVGAAADTQSLRIGASQEGLAAGAHKIYYIRLYESGELVRNYIPCTNPDGVAGLYETVEGQFLSSVTSTAYTVPS